MLHPDKLRRRLGKTFIDRLTQDVILTIGTHKLTRQDLVEHCRIGHFGCARRLGELLKDDLGITTPAQLAGLAPEDLAKIRGVGETTVFVLLHLQDYLKLRVMEFDTTWRTQVNRAQKPKKKTAKARENQKRTTTRPSRASIRKQTELFNTQQLSQ